MKNLFLLSMTLLSLQAFSQVDQQIDINEIKPVAAHASDLIRNFKVDGSDSISIGAPDYRFASEKLLEIISKKESNLNSYLDTINQKLKPDYQIIKALESQNKTPAISATLKQAKARYKATILGLQPSYYTQLSSFIFGDVLNSTSFCITVLCTEKIEEDILNWISTAKSINEDLDLNEATLQSLPRNHLRNMKKHIRSNLDLHKKDLPIALSQESTECQNLMDPSLTLAEVTLFGSKLTSFMGHDKIQAKLESDKENARIAEELRLKLEKKNEPIKKMTVADVTKILRSQSISLMMFGELSKTRPLSIGSCTIGMEEGLFGNYLKIENSSGSYVLNVYKYESDKDPTKLAEIEKFLKNGSCEYKD